MRKFQTKYPTGSRYHLRYEVVEEHATGAEPRLLVMQRPQPAQPPKLVRQHGGVAATDVRADVRAARLGRASWGRLHGHALHALRRGTAMQRRILRVLFIGCWAEGTRSQQSCLEALTPQKCIPLNPAAGLQG